MNIRKTAVVVALAAAGLVSAIPVLGQTTDGPVMAMTSRPAQKLVNQYGVLAGSAQNAESLVKGLRDGKQVLLLASGDSTNPDAATVTFIPATGKLGYGNINTALALAQADLAKQGITTPTPEQLAAVLNGGTIITAAGTTVTLAGILAQRQSGMGWGAIANAMGVKLGAVVSASKSNRPVSEFRAMNAQGRKTNVAATKTASGSADHGKSGQSNGHSGGQSGSHGNSGNSGGNSGGSGGGGGGGGRGK